MSRVVEGLKGQGAPIDRPGVCCDCNIGLGDHRLLGPDTCGGWFHWGSGQQKPVTDAWQGQFKAGPGLMVATGQGRFSAFTVSRCCHGDGGLEILAQGWQLPDRWRPSEGPGQLSQARIFTALQGDVA